MTDVVVRVARLRDRIKRKREEVHAYLDVTFYRQCHNVLHAVRKLDVNSIFASNPSGLPEYVVRVSRPMWWDLISKRLDKYEYAACMDFVHDMRLVVDNCYAYNGDASLVSALGRRIELAMEDLFVTELAVAPPDAREIINLGKGMGRARAWQLWEIICRYEGQGQGATATRQHIVPSQLKCATQRRVVAFLRQNARSGNSSGRTEKSQSHVQQKPAPPLPRPPTKSQTLPHPTRSVLEADADVVFNCEENVVKTTVPEPHFERVPQNQRSDFCAFRPVSPVHLDESSSSSVGEGERES